MKKFIDFFNHYFYILMPAVLLIFYVYATDALVEDNQNTRMQRDSAKQLLVWMQQNASAINPQTASTAGKAMSSVEALAYIEKLARQHEILPQMKNLRPVNNNTVRLWMKSVDFPRFVAMLDALLKNSSLSVSKLTITASGEPGLADTDLTISLK